MGTNRAGRRRACGATVALFVVGALVGACPSPSASPRRDGAPLASGVDAAPYAPAAVADAGAAEAAAVEAGAEVAADAGAKAADAGAKVASGPRTLGVVDLHVDLAWAVHAKGASLADPGRQASLARVRRGQVGALVVPLFVDRGYAMTPAEARAAYQATFASVAARVKSEGAGALTPFFAAPEPGRVRMLVSFEGMDGFVDDLAGARAWVARGACFAGLVHSRTNALGGASQDPDPKRRAVGLTARGKALAEALVDAGAVLDVAHASDATADDLAAVAEARGVPLVDTHTGARALADIPRNLDDARIARVARSGGVVGVSLYTGHLTARGHGAKATLDDYVRHVEHVRSIGGVAAVAIGSDLEGAITEPEGADGAATWPALDQRLAARGWSERDRDALFRANALRVLDGAAARGCGRDR